MALRIDNHHWAEYGDLYTTDIRRPNPDGQFWDLEVIAQDQRYTAVVEFADIVDISEEMEVFALDLDLGIAQDLRWKNAYCYAVTSSNQVRKLRFIVGTRDFLLINSAEIELFPDQYSLSQNFPNPFNPQTSILVKLEAAANVDLVVYNLLGEEIVRLADAEYRPAGYHSFIWKGYSAEGHRVASGIYFYKVQVRGLDGKLILNQTRKMVLVK